MLLLVKGSNDNYSLQLSPHFNRIGQYGIKTAVHTFSHIGKSKHKFLRVNRDHRLARLNYLHGIAVLPLRDQAAVFIADYIRIIPFPCGRHSLQRLRAQDGQFQVQNC